MSTITTRPNQTFVGGGVTVSDGGGAAQALSDDTDSTWVVFHHDDHPFFGFAEPTIPAGAKVKEGVLRAKARKSATSGNPLVINWHMYDPSSGTNILGIRDDVPVPNSTSTYTLLLDQGRGQPHIAPSNILVDGYSHGDGASPTVLFFALYFDTIVVAKPVVTITGPTGTISGDTTPTISWTNTLDSDGGAQRFWEVKLYTSASDPDTAPSSNESGRIAGGENSWTPTLSLADATWHAYVRVAQMVNTEQHWSAWAHQSFVVNIARPGVPSMTLTSEPASGRIKILNVTNAAAATTSLYQTQFSDDGTTWEYVRTSLGDGRSTPSGGAATIYDYEASMGATRSYRTRALHFYPGEGYATSAWSSTQTSSWTSTSWWVKPTETPSLSMAVTVRSHPSTTRAGRVGLFPPLNAKYPIAVQDKRSSASGQIVFRFATDVERDAFEALCDDSSVVLIQAPAGTIDWPDRYCALGDFERERVIDNSGSLFPYSFDSVQWTEVARP